MNKFNLIDEASILIIYDRMDKNTPKNIEELQNISIPTRYEFNIKDFKKGQRTFESDFNSKAEYIIFPGNTKYVKFYIPLNIHCDTDLSNDDLINFKAKSRVKLKETDLRKYLETVYMRGNKNKTVLDVYLNGEKLPDQAVLLTVYQGTVDVYFQEELLDEINEICFSVREVNVKNKYLNYTWYGDRKLVVSDHYFKNINTYSLYRNGQFLINNEDYVIDNGTLSLLGEVYEDDLFEVILENGDIYTLGKSARAMSNIIDVKDLYMTKDGEKTILDTIKQTVSKNNVFIYIDGYKICNDDIREINGSFFYLNDFTHKSGLRYYIMVKMNYNNTKDNMKFNYKDDYSKINHLYDKILIHRQLANKNTTLPFIFPNFFSVSQMMQNYPPIYIENLVENPFNLPTDRRVFAERAIETYIKGNSYNMNHFVKQFNQVEKEVFNLTLNEKNILSYIVRDTSGLPPFYEHDFNEERFLIIYNYKDTNFVEKIFVDGKLLSRNEYDIIIIRNTGYAYFYIKMDKILPNSNVKMIVEEGKNKVTYKNSFKTNYGIKSYKLDLDSIKISKLRYDLIKFFIKEDRNLSLVEGEDYKLQIINDEFYFIILNDYLYNKTIHYLNPFFIYRKDIKVGLNLVSSSAYLIDVNSLTDNVNNSYDKLAIVDIKCNNLEIYYDGYRLINGVDFVIIESTLYNSINSNKILFNIKIEIDKVLSFVFKERRETTILSEREITSKYGLLYARNTPYPIDPEYFDLYLDNVKLHSDDLTIYTNDLLRIENKNYLKYFSLISNVDLPNSIIQYLKDLTLFNKNSYEKFFATLVGQIGSIDKIFEYINDGNLKDEDKINRIEKDPNVIKYDLRLDTLYEHFEKGLIDKCIDCHNGVLEEDILNNEIFDYFPDKSIALDAGNELIFNYATMTTLENCYSTIMISELFGLERHNSVENDDGEIDDFKNHPMNKYIYDENKIILDASAETPSMHEFNAKEEIEVIVFGCESTL